MSLMVFITVTVDNVINQSLLVLETKRNDKKSSTEK